jgi:Zn-dependent M28 family amino/carboxypeptidase
VIALLEGSDPALKDQVVLLGAHLDHVGGQGDVYYPGANDNASGSAAVLAIARAMAGREGRPRRSMAFALWSSEEAGLFGTRNFVEHPPFPLERVVAYLNFDCVGHGDSIEVGGGEEYPGFWNAAREIDRSGRGLMVADTRGGGGADAQPFQQAGIPNLYFASRFSYAHLHQPTDRPETLNPPLLAAVARLGRDLAWKIAQAEVEARAE